MKKQRRSLWIALCGVVASLGLMLGVWSNGLVRADAAATPPTLTMDAGASVRKTAGRVVQGRFASGYKLASSASACSFSIFFITYEL